jgi:acyl-CoA thioester hydrolase
MPNEKHFYRIKILEEYLDTFEHVNHASYLVLFEQARWDWITEKGYGLKEVRETQIGPVILSLEIQYRKELSARQEIVIESEVTSHQKLFTQIHQEMKSPDGTTHSIVDLKFGCFDLKRRKLIVPTPAWSAALGLPQENTTQR